MDRAIFIGTCLLGMGAALAVFYPLGARRRAVIPSAVWWVCLGVGVVVCIYGLAHSTAPSFAPRVTAVGKAYDHVEVRQGRDTHYGFRFVPDGSGEPVDIETSIILLGWARPEVFNGRTFRVVYLQSNSRALKNEAIDIEILAGRDAGFHDSVDARPYGVWLPGVFLSFDIRAEPVWSLLSSLPSSQTFPLRSRSRTLNLSGSREAGF